MHEYFSLGLIQASLDASSKTDQRLLPDQCLLHSGCAYKQPETRASVVPRILLSFRHRKQLIFQAILKDKGLQILSYTLRRRKHVWWKASVGLVNSFTVFSSLLHNQQVSGDDRTKLIDSLCFKSLVKKKVDL